MPRPLIAGLTAMLSAVALFWLMGMNFCGWLGAWIAPGAAWIVGILLAAVLGVGFGYLWSGSLGRAKAARKLPPVVAALLYGIAVGLVFIVLVPLLLSAVAGNPPMAHSTAFDALVGGFGGHIVPALPDWFSPPMKSWVDHDWIHLESYGARVLPFLLAFGLYGVVLGVTSDMKN
jgi:hypothetical protein